MNRVVILLFVSLLDYFGPLSENLMLEQDVL